MYLHHREKEREEENSIATSKRWRKITTRAGCDFVSRLRDTCARAEQNDDPRKRRRSQVSRMWQEKERGA